MPENITKYTDSDPDMVKAYSKAKSTLKYFVRELSWEERRIIPGLGLAACKVAFNTGMDGADAPDIEYMWVNNLRFNDITVTGTLLNKPNWVSNLQSGDNIEFDISRIVDWVYSVSGKAYGAFSVNVIRKSMSSGERKNHDKAWGLDFGDPDDSRIFHYEVTRKKLFSRKLKSDRVELYDKDHPMCLNMLQKYEDQLKQSPDEILNYRDSAGNSLLHTEALSGNKAMVNLLLKYGAKKDEKNSNGKTPLDMAKIFNWEEIINLLD